jgi:predicted nucleotidyltransferase
VSHQTNIVRLKAIANLLHQLNEEFVFVGGATVSLYGDDTRTEARPTDDVDVVIELATYTGFAALDEKLRKAGFENDIESGVICRYNIQGMIVDIMPTDPSVIGFSNRWYPDGFKNAISIQLDDCFFKIFSLPYFIASKIEAFKGRGHNNYLYSSDFEDIVYVLENNAKVAALIKVAPQDVREYLKQSFIEFRRDPNFEEGLSAHLEPETQEEQLKKIQINIKEII